ncbi:FAD-binding oxidoreductase [Pseudolysinimonas yzui]|uniref:FAD-linked oxidase n=1 Tax=Pseudolysinimonas yzui TaxID=2708254 RepID=A0A8J3GPM8_9MICO|nr:FAD-binding oxidoreductase [Pseudolysinimonas yzui]GHF11481.1 FAD-linked oxidase [Pseudolysinimonas yzui]
MDLSTLSSTVTGRVLTPGDDDYLEAATVAKGPGSPVAVVRPADAADVATAVGFARDAGLALSVRSGGHDSLGRSTNDGGIVIDLRSLADVEIAGDLVTIGSGAVWGDVAAALAPHGLAISSGDTQTVGVGGLTLGGGVGWFVRLWGLAIDSLVSAQVVLADGRVVTASETSEPDLFWAIRGGGGNFGVVTHFTFRAHPLPDGVVSGAIDFAPDTDLAAAFTVWRDTLRTAPEQLSTTYMGMPAFGDMPGSSQIVFVWAGGDVEEARDAITPLLGIPGVTGHTIERMPYAEVLLAEQPDAAEVDAPAIAMVTDNGFAARFDDALIAELADVKREMGDTVLMVRLLGGAYGRVAPDATAWGYRDTEAWIISVAFFPEGEIFDAHAPRIRQQWARLDAWLSGMYGNFSDLPDAVERMYPPATLARLRSVKGAYDPANLFHRTANIRP